MSNTHSTLYRRPERVRDDILSQDSERLYRRRMDAGLSMARLAALAGVSKGSISMLESDDMSASPEMLSKLSRALGCTPLDLMPPDRSAARTRRIKVPAA